MGTPLDSSFLNFCNSGLSTVEPKFNEPFTYSGSLFYGNFAEAIFQEQLMNGGFKNIRGNTLVVRKSVLPSYPIIGSTLLKDDITYRVLGVTADECTYTVTLADTSK